MVYGRQGDGRIEWRDGQPTDVDFRLAEDEAGGPLHQGCQAKTPCWRGHVDDLIRSEREQNPLTFARGSRKVRGKRAKNEEISMAKKCSGSPGRTSMLQRKQLVRVANLPIERH
jgi:hypothetical protein